MPIQDFTRLHRRDNRIFEFGGFSLGSGGLSVSQLAISGAAALVTGVILVPLGRILVGPIGTLVGVMLALGCGVAGYFLSARKPHGATPVEQILMTVDYLTQPRTIAGFTKDNEPNLIQWQVSPWVPTQPEWLEAYRLFLHADVTTTEPAVDMVATHGRLLELDAFIKPIRRTTA